MIIRTLLLSTCFLTATPFFAEQPVSFTVLFDHDEHTLTEEMGASLEAFLKNLEIHKVKRVFLSGHTDDSGSLSYNEALSERRALSVQIALDSYGVNPRILEKEAYGERMPLAANTSEEGQGKNRRVEILIEFADFSNLDEFHKELRQGTQSTHYIDPARDSRVIGEEGITLDIAGNSLLDESGNPAKGPVRIELMETCSFEQFVSEGLTTNSNGQLIETGGMVRIDAFDESGKPLKLDPTKPLDISVPTDDFKPGMQTFISENGSDWAAANAPRRIRTISTTFRTGPRKPHVRYPSFIPPKFQEDIASMPGHPIEPVYPKRPSEPRKESYSRKVKWYQFYKRDAIERASARAWKQAQDRYAARLKKYEMRVESYHRDCDSYPSRVMAYHKRLDAWTEQQMFNKANFYNDSVVPAYERHQAGYARAKKALEPELRAWKQLVDSLGMGLIDSDTTWTVMNQDTSMTAQLTNYLISTTQLGWINCDRFIETPPSEKFIVNLKTPFKNEGRMLMVFEDINSVIDIPNQNGRHVYRGLPKNRGGKLIAYYIENDELYMSSTPANDQPVRINDFRLSSISDFLMLLDDPTLTAQLD